MLRSSENYSFICNKEDVPKVTYDISNNIKVQDVICLYGNIGAGKTTFSKYLISHIVKNSNIELITSPTFNIVHQYEGDDFTLWHFDFYRLKHIEEVYNIGFEDALNYGVSIIEWPNIVENLLPKSALKIFIDFTDNSNARKISINKPILKI